MYSYKFLPIAGASVIENLTDITSFSYDAAKKELVSYDTPRIVAAKAKYAQDKGLAGGMFWDVRISVGMLRMRASLTSSRSSPQTRPAPILLCPPLPMSSAPSIRPQYVFVALVIVPPELIQTLTRTT